MNDDVAVILLVDDLRRRFRDVAYDPVRGLGCIGRRVAVTAPWGDKVFVPQAMTLDPAYPAVVNNTLAWKRLRCRHDFEYWCATCAVVRLKDEGRDGPFILNAPQRRVAAVLEGDRTARQPIRLILLKARQWGGSTLVQMYMAWIQSCLRRDWNSLICAHVKDAASGIRGMYTKLLDNYPADLWDGDEKPQFKPYERTCNVRQIVGRGCRVTIGSSENQDAVRGADYAMAHLSETAFWASTPQRSPQGFIQAVCGAITLQPDTLVAVESTANGVGNYFHTEWLRCKEGRGDKHAVFVPWYEIEIYRLAPPCPEAVAATLDDYERRLWDMGLALDQVYWYRRKAAEYGSLDQMHAEFPTDDVEAFLNSGSGVFSPPCVEALRKGCCKPGAVGALDASGTGFVADSKGSLSVWELPVRHGRYVVAVDVGGRSAKADWSVIAVLKVPRQGLPEVVAQWRGHVDHDMLARKSAAVARFYNKALLIIESNTFETADSGGATDSNLFVLNRLASEYGNLYRRRTFDKVTNTYSTNVGFHTNRSTKALLIGGLIEAVREGAYIERDNEACNELMVYEQRPNGSYGAKDGYHDDILMTRAIALHVIATEPLPNLPDIITQRPSW